LASLHTKRVLA